MSHLAEILLSADFLKFAVPLLGAVAAWFINEWRKRLADQYLRKEANYKKLIEALRGFYVGAANADVLKSEFLSQLNVAWLYCPDDVIKKGYAFLETVHKESTHTDQDKEHAMGALVLALRADLLSHTLVRTTSLAATDFKHLSSK